MLSTDLVSAFCDLCNLVCFECWGLCKNERNKEQVNHSLRDRPHTRLFPHMAAQPRRSDGSREHGELPERPIHGLSVEALANESVKVEKNRRTDDYESKLEDHGSARSNNMSTSSHNLVNNSIEPSTPENQYNDVENRVAINNK